MEYRIKEVGDKTEISVVFSTPTVDMSYIEFSNEKLYKGKIGCMETRDKEQFIRLSEIFKNTHFYQNEFWGKTCEFYMQLKRLKEIGILEDDIDVNIDNDGCPIGYPEYMDTFIECSVAYMEGNNIQKDGLYFYPVITDWHIESALEFVKKEYKDDLLRLLPYTQFIYGNVKLRCDFILKSFSELRLHTTKERYTYVMSDVSGYYKIGKSFYPEYRKSQLSCGNPTLKLEFFINGDREYELQKHFESKRVNGEWFSLNKNDLKYIKNYNNIRK